ncbi:MAG: hypothetical protein Q8R12_04960 [bacterium]|nr:hypothetical protein [bacterium]
MVNPAEDIVNIWLQECNDHFTMSNIVVPKETREIRGRKVGGGRGKEIDLISTDGKNYFWIEVSVSPNPRLSNKNIRFKEAVNAALNKFANEKEKYLKNRFDKPFRKWFIYSPKLFLKTSNEEIRYCKALKRKGIEAVSFKRVLKNVYDKLNYMGFDVTRNYLFLLKKFRE